jgi:hypothetical protein
MTYTHADERRLTTRRHNRPRGSLALGVGCTLAVACALAGALLTAAPASAHSRAFVLHNLSKHYLQLDSAKPVPRTSCAQFRCPANYGFEFEGRPSDGAVVEPGGVSESWELKYEFSPDLFGFDVLYAALLTYKVEGTGGTVEYVIERKSYTNDSFCKVIGANVGSCTAEGLKLTFK